MPTPKSTWKIQQTSADADLARYAASRLIAVWPWSAPLRGVLTNDVHESVKLLLKSVGLRKRGPRRTGVLDRFFKEKQRIGINISVAQGSRGMTGATRSGGA